MLLALFGLLTNIAVAQVNNTKTTENEDFDDADAVFMIIEEAPEFPVGMDALYKFMAANIQYPEQAKEDNIQGKVFLSFIVEKDGRISNLFVKREHKPNAVWIMPSVVKDS